MQFLYFQILVLIILLLFFWQLFEICLHTLTAAVSHTGDWLAQSICEAT